MLGEKERSLADLRKRYKRYALQEQRGASAESDFRKQKAQYESVIRDLQSALKTKNSIDESDSSLDEYDMGPRRSEQRTELKHSRSSLGKLE